MSSHVAEANDYRLATDGAVEVASASVREAHALAIEAARLIDALQDMPLTVEHERWRRVHAAAWKRWARRLNKKWIANDRRNDV